MSSSQRPQAATKSRLARLRRACGATQVSRRRDEHVSNDFGRKDSPCMECNACPDGLLLSLCSRPAFNKICVVQSWEESRWLALSSATRTTSILEQGARVLFNFKKTKEHHDGPRQGQGTSLLCHRCQSSLFSTETLLSNRTSVKVPFPSPPFESTTTWAFQNVELESLQCNDCEYRVMNI